MYSEQLKAKLLAAFEQDGNASHYISFERWASGRSIALEIIANHKEL